MNAEISKMLTDAADEYQKEKYGLYLRKSRADLELEAMGEEETLARHKRMLMNLAEKHGITPSQITIYHELVSGDSIDERPEMQRLLDDVFAKKYKGVLVVEVERLARGNTKDQGEVAEAFQYSHTQIITPAKVYNPENEYDQEYFEFGLFMSRREYKTIRRRLESGKKQSVEEGNFVPSIAPYGFTAVRKSKKERVLVENPEQSKYVKMIFDWYTEDRKPMSWIAKQLTLMGVPTAKGNREWKRASVKDILFNIHYIGKVYWGDQQTIRVKDPVTGKTSKKRIFTGEQQIYEGKHDGFISEEQFAKVKQFYGVNAPAKMNFEITNPLAGIMRCARCGSSIGYNTYCNNKPARYHHTFGVYACKMKTIECSVLIDALVQSLKESIADFEIKIEAGNENSEAERQETLLKELQAELAKQEKMKRRLFDSWDADDGMYTREEFLERKAMYVSAISTLQGEIEKFKDNVPAPVDYQSKIVTLHQAIDCITNDQISAKEKNIFLKSIIEKITFDTEDLGYRKGAKALLEVYLK